MDMKRLAQEERADLAAYLATLSPNQWDAPTLCAGWRVRDVVAHMVSYEELDGRALAGRFAKGRFLPDKVNAVGVAEYGERGPDELLALLKDHLEPRGLTAAFGGMVALVDGLIHHQDIRRPLGTPREIPEDRLRAVLRVAFLAPQLGAFWRARGLRLVATDLDWSRGTGAEVRGPAEAILMSVTGRSGAVDELSGPGSRTLADRIDRIHRGDDGDDGKGDTGPA